MKMKAVEYRDWPKPTLRRQTGLVARIEGDFEAMVELLSVRPKAFTQKATRTEPEVKYRSIFLVLSNGAPAALTEYAHKPGAIELNLQVERDRFAFDEDYAEVISALGLKPKQVKKFEGNFTWLADRKSKRVEPPEEPLPEDWWNHIRVPPPAKSTR